jgi:glycine cleavage system transcriptional repressor
MRQLAVTVIGRDQPGVVAGVTDMLAELEGNLEDSTATILRGHFATRAVSYARGGS